MSPHRAPTSLRAQLGTSTCRSHRTTQEPPKNLLENKKPSGTFQFVPLAAWKGLRWPPGWRIWEKMWEMWEMWAMFLSTLSHRLSVFTFNVKFKNLWHWALPVPNGAAHSCIPTAPQSWNRAKSGLGNFLHIPTAQPWHLWGSMQELGVGEGKTGELEVNNHPWIHPQSWKSKTPPSLLLWELIPAGIPPLEQDRHHKDFWESQNNFYWLLQAWGLKKSQIKGQFSCS